MKNIITARLCLDEARAALDAAIDRMNEFANVTRSLDVLDEKLVINEIERKLVKKYNDWATTDDPKYLDCELYEVTEDEDGSKVVHIDGYIFAGDDGLQLVQFTDIIFRLKDTDSWKYEDFMDIADCCNQYQVEISEEDAVKYYEKATPLQMCCLSEETPCGWYVNKF